MCPVGGLIPRNVITSKVVAVDGVLAGVVVYVLRLRSRSDGSYSASGGEDRSRARSGRLRGRESCLAMDLGHRSSWAHATSGSADWIQRRADDVSVRSARVRVPASYPIDRVLVGELHLLRGRLDETLLALAGLVAMSEPGEEWLRTEEAARLARRALAAAVEAAPALRSVRPQPGELQVGGLRIDPVVRRQWYGEAEFELTPLHHRLLATLAEDPYRVFGKDELLRVVWGCSRERTNSVNTSVSRLRRALRRAGAPPGHFLISLHGVGWALTRPDQNHES